MMSARFALLALLASLGVARGVVPACARPAGSVLAARARTPRSALLAGPRAPKEESGEGEKKKGLSLGGLVQLVTMGAGAPSLGEYKGMDGNTAMFELEANNFEDKDGNVRKGRYFEDGYVDDPAGGDAPPGFLENLLSGGQLQREYDERTRK